MAHRGLVSDDTSTSTKNGNRGFLFVIVMVTVDMLGFGLIIPVMPSLIKELTGQSVEDAVVWGGVLTATYAFMNFMAGPFLGNLSDRYGRRPVLLYSTAMLGVDFLIMALAGNIWLLFLGRALAGISSATFSTANAYIADVTPPEKRGAAFGMIGAAFGIGFVIGPAFGGLLGIIDARAPFYAAAALCFANVLYGVFILPESLAPEDRRPLDLKRANPVGTFIHFSKVPQVAWFIIAGGLFTLANSVFPSTWNFHGEIRFGWGPAEIGASLAAVGVTAAIVQAGLMGRIINAIGDIRTVLLGACVTIVCLVGYAFADIGWITYLIIPISALGGVVGPGSQSIMSNLTPKDRQGELQGAIASLNSLSIAIAPILMTQTLHHFSKADAPIYFPGAAFLLAAALTTLALVPFMAGVRANRKALPTAGK
ncbi:MAG: TCR/Tet family MFS transporter [Pseudomonadota bacterium]